MLKTAEDLLAMTAADDGRRYELVRGELREMAPTGGTHGKIAFSIASIIAAHIRGKDLGEGFTAEAGFITGRNPDSVRAPDVAFVSKERLPKSGVPEGFVRDLPGPRRRGRVPQRHGHRDTVEGRGVLCRRHPPGLGRLSRLQVGSRLPLPP